jgi:thiamine-phosphate pyrophosphorylase
MSSNIYKDKELKFNLISYPVFFKGEADIVTRLLQSFDFTYHLRKPNASAFEYKAMLDSIPENLHYRIIIHNAFELTTQFKLKGIHFSEKYRMVMHKLQIDCLKCTTCHTFQELDEIKDNYDYSFLSPIFQSQSKPFYYPGLDYQEIHKYLKGNHQIKVIALGGINEHNINQIQDLPFDGIAVLGAVWKDCPDDVSLVINNFKKIYKSYSPDFQN